MEDPSGGGHVIAARYQLVKQLGKGGMGSVWIARDLTLGSPVAIKLIDAELASDEALRARFYQEAKSAAALRSPHVVQIFDYGLHGGVPYIAMELLEGDSLGDRLARVSVLPYAETTRVMLDVARAMKKAHEAGIVHRDLKPDNIFLVRNDDQEIAKVLDFGIAKATHATGAQASMTRTGTLVGTLPYMSPEQATGNHVDWRSDVWAMGVIAFECVCGRLPFTSDVVGELVLQICVRPLPVPSEIARVPRGFDAFWARASSRDPARRFQSAKELADALALVLASGVDAHRPVAAATTADPAALGDSAVTTEIWTSGARRGPWPLVLGGVAGVVVMGGLIAWLASRPSAAADAPSRSAAPTAAPAPVSAPVPAPVVAPAAPFEPSAQPEVTATPAPPPTSSAPSPRPGHGAPPSTATLPKKRTMD